MGPDSNLVELTVAEGYDGGVVLGGTCSDEESTLAGGDAITVERDSPGEGCSYTVAVDGTVETRDDVAGYETARIDVSADGDVEESVPAV